MSRPLLPGLLLAALLAPGLAEAACGDLVIDVGEQCDDGNTDPDDGCGPTCLFEPGVSNACSASDVDITLSSPTVLNTYWAAPAAESSIAQGATSITLGARRGDATPIQAGDRLMIIQMQGAEIDPGESDDVDDPYGDGAGPNDRSGFLDNANFTAGTYEIVLAAGPESGGVVPIYGRGVGDGTEHAYTNSRVVTATQGYH